MVSAFILFAVVFFLVIAWCANQEGDHEIFVVFSLFAGWGSAALIWHQVMP